MTTRRTVIVASGSYIPERVIGKDYFLDHDFRGVNGEPIAKTNAEILDQFEEITGIHERRYVTDDLMTSDIAYEAALGALESSGIDRESLDCIIVAHNFGDVAPGSHRSDLVPAIAARVKAKLRIKNPHAAAFDLIFGCPGWIQGVLQIDAMIRAGDIERGMVIGADTLSRISDPHDRDSLIYADGAGAVILEARETDPGDEGILAHVVRSDTLDHSGMLSMGPSYNSEVFLEALFLKMEGRKLYKYALQNVAGAMKGCLDKVGVDVAGVKKILLHQANGKMDEAIGDAFFQLYGIAKTPDGVLPLTIAWLGNSSVATVPTLYDLIVKGRFEGQALNAGDLALFASVGAGMNINAFLYRMPS